MRMSGLSKAARRRDERARKGFDHNRARKEYVHYDQHVWLLKNNPLGMFAPTNPDVNCEGYEYALLEKPTKMIHGP